jgi:hypothetical protein
MKKIMIGIILSISIIFLSCASSPYRVQKSVDRELLRQDTVILEIFMLPRSLQIFPLIDAGIYNTALKNSEEDFSQIETTRLRFMNEEIRSKYAEMFNARVVRSNFSFDGNVNKLNYFSEADEKVKEQLVRLCEENRGEIIVAIVGQIQCTNVSAFGINGTNRMNVNICIFDRRGQIIAQGRANTQGITTFANDTESYALLFQNGTTVSIGLLNELTSR